MDEMESTDTAERQRYNRDRVWDDLQSAVYEMVEYFSLDQVRQCVEAALAEDETPTGTYPTEEKP